MIAPARKPTEMPVMALIDGESYRVDAFFEETKILHIRPGASAEIYLMDGSPMRCKESS